MVAKIWAENTWSESARTVIELLPLIVRHKINLTWKCGIKFFFFTDSCRLDITIEDSG